MQVILDPTKDILSLYTPYAPPSRLRVEHTRSVLLQPQSKETPSLFNIISSVTFALVVSIPLTVPIDYLLRHMLTSYAREHFAMHSKNNDCLKHAHLYRGVKEGDEDADFLTLEARLFLRRIDLDNRKDYEYTTKNGIFKECNKEEQPWQWLLPSSVAIEDEEYRVMRNINFIREVKQVYTTDKALAKSDAQYRLLFDNHLILYHFLRQFRHGTVSLHHKETKFDCRLALLDPVCDSLGRYELFEGGNHVYYVEKQLNNKENRDFHASLHFSETFPYTGGLLHPSTYDHNDAAHRNEKNTVEAMYNNCVYEDNSGQRLTKKQLEGSRGFRLCYNRFYVDLSTSVHTHVEYTTRGKALINERKTAKPKKTKAVEPTKGKVIKLGKNQPTLQSVVANIPDESKRKHAAVAEPVPAVTDEARPAKKPRIEQAKISSFFVTPTRPLF